MNSFQRDPLTRQGLSSFYVNPIEPVVRGENELREYT